MSEVIEPATIRKLPLEATHQRLNATMIESDDWSLPASYGDMRPEYDFVRSGGAGVIDLSQRGRIVVTGSEAIQFLNGLITNDMKTLAENSWMPAAFPNIKGRLIASVRVIRLTDDGYLIDTESATHNHVLKTIERFTLAGDFKVTDISHETVQLTVQGKQSPNVIGSVFGEEVTALARDGALQAAWRDGKATVIRATHTGADGFDVVVNSDQGEALWNALASAGAKPVGNDALEVLRIEAGIPRYGIDMDETNVVTETGLDDAVSFTKGCYVGQEIIARIKYRGHVAKKLSGLTFDSQVTVRPGAVITSLSEEEIGRITSTTVSPLLNRTIGLGYLKYDFLDPTTSVSVASDEGPTHAQVTELPFLRE
jgi:folate-binding protein YgfZ